MTFRWPLASAALLLWAPVAWAQEPADDDVEVEDEEVDQDEDEIEDEPEEPVQPDTSTFDPDAKPEPPSPALPNPAEETKSYAGVGSGVAYAERGVAEFGGALTFALSNNMTSFSADPMIGYYLYDNFQLSGILGFRHVGVNGQQSNRFSLAAEPSIHVPINEGLFWVGGIGTGLALGDDVDQQPGVDAGWLVAPRTGVQFLIGRSGLLNAGIRYSAVFSGVSADVTPVEGQAVLAFTNTFDLQAGYTIMF